MQVVVQDQLVNYAKSGSGSKTILLLHGWGDNHQTFNIITKDLSGYRLIALDLPGFGGSEPPKKAWSLDDYSLFVADFLRKIDAKPTYVVGHSNGGAIAIRATSMGALTPKKLILIASSGIRRPSSFRSAALKILAKSGKLIMHLAPNNAQARLRSSFYKRIGSDYHVVPSMRETFKKVVAQDVLEDARSINQPVCLIYGDQDLATPPAYGGLFADAFTDSVLHILEGAGHFVHQDQPKETVGIIKAFLSK